MLIVFTSVILKCIYYSNLQAHLITKIVQRLQNLRDLLCKFCLSLFLYISEVVSLPDSYSEEQNGALHLFASIVALYHNIVSSLSWD